MNISIGWNDRPGERIVLRKTAVVEDLWRFDNLCRWYHHSGLNNCCKLSLQCPVYFKWVVSFTVMLLLHMYLGHERETCTRINDATGFSIWSAAVQPYIYDLLPFSRDSACQIVWMTTSYTLQARGLRVSVNNWQLTGALKRRRNESIFVEKANIYYISLPFQTLKINQIKNK